MDYTIKQGDNLSTIAQNNNTDVATLSKLNNIQNPNLIQTGQVIKLGNNTQTNAPTQNLSGNITPAPVSVQDIQKPVAPIEVPVAPVQTQAPVSTNLAQDILNKTAVAETDAQKTARELSTKISSLLPSTVGETQALADAKKQYQVDELSKNLNDINSQILMKQAELNKDDASLAMGIQNIEDKPIAMEFITGQQASVQRQAQIARMAKNAEIGILNARALGLQGNIELATKMAQQAVDLKYAPIKETINLYSAQLKALEPLLSADEKKVAREQEIKTKLAMNEVEQKQADEKKIQELILNASSQGASSSLISKASLAKTPIEVAQILGEFGGKDYLQNQKLRLEIAKLNTPTTTTGATTGATIGSSKILSNGKSASSQAQTYLSQINAGVSYDDVIKTIGASKDRAWLRDEVTDLYRQQGNKPVLSNDNGQITDIQNQIDTIKKLSSNGELYGAISGVYQGLGGFLNPNDKGDALTLVSYINSKGTLKSLSDAKANGVTFGALSAPELNVAAGAASRLSARAIKDKDTGEITGFKGSEKAFLEDLKLVQDGLEKSIKTKTGTTGDTGADKAKKAKEAENNASQVNNTYGYQGTN